MGRKDEVKRKREAQQNTLESARHREKIYVKRGMDLGIPAEEIAKIQQKPVSYILGIMRKIENERGS